LIQLPHDLTDIITMKNGSFLRILPDEEKRNNAGD